MLGDGYRGMMRHGEGGRLCVGVLTAKPTGKGPPDRSCSDSN